MGTHVCGNIAMPYKEGAEQLCYEARLGPAAFRSVRAGGPTWPS